MPFRKSLPVVIALFSSFFISLTNTNASSVAPELSPVPSYDFRRDPFLVDWTFGGVRSNSPTDIQPAQMSQDEKILARWKEKQARLWGNLPTGKFTINASAYTAAADECGKNDGITASGLKVEEHRTLACPSSFPFGTKIAIEGMGEYRCEDRGGAIRGNKIDIYMETKKQAFAFGRRHLVAEVIR